ncbi:MAG: protein kinase domain-containing protein [Rubripirellula sp.]
MPQNPNEPDSLDHDLTQAYSSDQRASQTDSLDDGNTAGGIGSSSSDISRFDEGWEQATESKGLETRYEVAEAIGHGGMGEVYKGTDTRLKRPVAIKRLKGNLSNNKRAVERFSTEAEAVARLNHYNIVQIYDVGHDAQGHYIVMELVEGDSLAARLKQSGAIQLDAAIEMVAQLCEALAYAHQQGIVHRDIKPANILLAAGDIPKLTDFGLARLENHDHGQTRAGAVLGTIDFMPPEQHRDAHSADAKSDQWALAATMYQMITGESPRVIRSKRIPEQIRDVLLKALEDAPDKRFEDCQVMRDALLNATAGDSPSENSVLEHEPGYCVQCKRMNRPEMTFCESCGSSLTTPCPKCEQTVGVWASFCGNCGSDLGKELENQISQLKKLKIEIPSLRRSYQHAEAIKQLEAVCTLTHPAFVEQKQWAEMLLPQYREELSRLEKQRDEIVEAASQRMNGHDVEGALQLLDRVPASITNGRITALRKQAEARKEELQVLGDVIRTAIATKQFEGLKEKVEQFLFLRPQDEKARKLLRQLQKREKQAAETLKNKEPPNSGNSSTEEIIESSESLPEFSQTSSSPYLRHTPRKKECSPLNRPLITIAIALSIAAFYYLMFVRGPSQDSAVAARSAPQANSSVKPGSSSTAREEKPLQSTTPTTANPTQSSQAIATVTAEPASSEAAHPNSIAPVPDSDNKPPPNNAPTPPSSGAPMDGPAPAVAPFDAANGWIELFNGRDLSGWSVGFDDATKLKTERRWGFDPATQAITASGEDIDYLISDQRFTNYTLDLQWRFPQGVQRGNGSGIMLHSNGSVAELDPVGLEIDLLPRALTNLLDTRNSARRSGGLGMFGTGCILTYGFSAANHSGSSNGWMGEENRRHLDWLQPPKIKQLNEWNRMTITAVNGRVLIYINDFLVNEAWGLSANSGKIILRCQKAPVEFRCVRIKKYETEKEQQTLLLQGKWQSVGQETGRMAWTPSRVRAAGKTVAFDGKQFVFRYTHSNKAVIEKGTYRINPRWNPRHIDMTGEYQNAPDSKFEFSGIYNFKEQYLLHCFVKSHEDPTRQRPARFEGIESMEFSASYKRDLSTPLNLPLPPRNPTPNPPAVRPEVSSSAAGPSIEIPSELNGGVIDTCPWLSPDGRRIYWLREGEQSKPSQIWTAQRASPEHPFDNLRPLVDGRLFTLSDDELEIIFLKQKTGRLQRSTRSSQSHSFRKPTTITELISFDQPKSPQLVLADRTLLFNGPTPQSINSPIRQTRIWVCNRSSPGSPWSFPRILPLHPEVETPTWPSFSMDGLTLFLANGGGKDSLLMMGTRRFIGSDFTNPFHNVAVDQRLIYGRAPRYVESTQELWYATCPDSNSNQWELRVINNFKLP